MASHEFGGLGVGSIKAKNLRLLGKWYWRFKHEKKELWIKVISSIYGNDGGFNSSPTSLGKGVWNSIRKACVSIDRLNIPFSNTFNRKIGNGVTFSFGRIGGLVLGNA